MVVHHFGDVFHAAETSSPLRSLPSVQESSLNLYEDNTDFAKTHAT
jgi:hypothetical protein